MQGVFRLSLVVVLVFATAGACSPRLKRKFHELRMLEWQKAAREAAEAGRDPPAVPNLSEDLDLDLAALADLEGLESNSEGANDEEPTSQTSSVPSSPHWLAERSVRAPSPRSPRSQLHKLVARAGRDYVVPAEVEALLASGNFDPETFNPTPYEVGTPEWNMAMINFLLEMKAKGHKINEVQADKTLADIHKDLQLSQAAGNASPLVCKTAPYNICYRLDKHGNLHPIGNRRPVRILRVYK